MNLNERLSEVDNILTELRLQAVVDSGTLLGLIRDGDVIPFDNDLDLAAMNWSESDISRVTRRLQDSGFVTSHTLFGGKRTALYGWRRGDPLHVNFFLFSSKAHGFFWKFGWVSTEKNQRLSPPTRSLRHSLRRIVRSRRHNQSWQSFASSIDRLWLLNPRTHRALGLWAVPQQYFTQLKPLDGLSALKMPAAVEEYLKYCYGEDWRTPSRSWNSWLQDGRVVRP